MGQQSKGGSGYGKPPVHSQFKKGESGNPSGRPKVVPSFKSDLLQVLRGPYSVEENGQITTVTKQEAIARSLTSAALNNDMRAVNILLGLLKNYGVENDESAPEGDDFEDLDALQTYIDNQRKQQSRE